jgi:hypothetical protein
MERAVMLELMTKEERRDLGLLPRSSHLSRAIHHHVPYRPCIHLAFATFTTIPKRLLISSSMSSKPAIPEWQRASANDAAASQEPEEASAQHAVEAPTPTEDDVENDNDNKEQSSGGSGLLEQASRFLEDDAIRDAPREKKVAFLQSKGVSAEDIETLLGTETHDNSRVELEDVGERAWATVSTDPPRLKRIKPRLSTASQ